MKTYILQHAPFEGPGILDTLNNAEVIRLYENASLPAMDELGLLVLLGGPMNVNDDLYWLHEERKFVKQAIEARKPILGICLGAQIIADAIGGNVYKNPNGKEVGWWPVSSVIQPMPFGIFPDKLNVLHWHGNTFSLPPTATTFYSTMICQNQAFLYTDRVVGLQFHLETTADSLQTLVDADEDFITTGTFVQTKEQLLNANIPSENHDVLLKLVQYLENRLAF